jgi:hypothetical protein
MAYPQSKLHDSTADSLRASKRKIHQTLKRLTYSRVAVALQYEISLDHLDHARSFARTLWAQQVAAKTKARGICGKDLNKKGTPAGEIPIPEAAGLAVGCVFLLCVTCFELLHYYDIGSLVHWVASGFVGTGPREELVSDAWLVDYNAALATIGFMMFLGFADDVLDVPWRVKLVLPLFASLPLLAAYSGGTGVSVPQLMQTMLGLPGFVELGVLYQVCPDRQVYRALACMHSYHFPLMYAYHCPCRHIIVHVRMFAPAT